VTLTWGLGLPIGKKIGRASPGGAMVP